jgi:baseplate J-like protein
VSAPVIAGNPEATASAFDTCGCCADHPFRPAVANRPGLPSLAYRIGTHATFLNRMLARLSALDFGDGSGQRPLALLTTRAPDDLSIGLLDAWATVADVLTFYQERIANEGFLRTATERRSVLELARAIGYELNPGVAASTYLAFTLETAAGAPGRATIAEGVKVQSVPGQDERPQVFETIEQIEARAEWNILRPRLTEQQTVRKELKHLLLAGVNTGLQPGDAILVVGDERLKQSDLEEWDFRFLRTVEPRPAEGNTLVTWDKGLGNHWPPASPALLNAQVFALRQRAALFGHNAPDWRAMPSPVKAGFKTGVPSTTPPESSDWCTEWPKFKIEELFEAQTIHLDAIYPKIQSEQWTALVRPNYKELYRITSATPAAKSDFTLTAKTTRLDLDTTENLSGFGLRETVVFAQSEALPLAEQPIAALLSGSQVELDRLVRGLEKGRQILVSGQRRRIAITEQARKTLALTSDADSSVTLPLNPGDRFTVLEPATVPDPDNSKRKKWHLIDRNGFAGTAPIDDDEIREEPPEERGEVLVEVAVIAGVAESDERTVLSLAQPLRNSYERTTVSIHANVARATHGESVREVMGSGDGSRPNQRFALKRPFVTYVPAATPSGAKNTLSVRVDGVRWDETRSLFGLEADSQNYIASLDNEGRTTVVFGDGARGARLPTGVENVVATYRAGIGPEGEVRAGALTLLQTRPFGVREVTNPLPATGAAGPEVLEDARSNAPITVLTLDRIVSLQDFEDFAAAFAGVGKAQAIGLWKGEQRVVYITVASVSGKPVKPDSALYQNLVAAIDGFRDPAALVEVGSYTLSTFSLEARVLVDPRYQAEEVLPQVRRALTVTFGFAKRAFGQPVTAADVLAVMQSVPGVLAVDLDRLTLDAEPEPRATELLPTAVPTAPGAPPTGRLDWARVPTLSGTQGSVAPTQVLLAKPAGFADTTVQPAPEVLPAELLLINPFGITLRAVTA